MYKGLMLAKAIMSFIQTTNNPPKVGEGVVKSRLAPPGRVESVLECSFTPCKLRFCAHFRLARNHNPAFYDTLSYFGRIVRRLNKRHNCFCKHQTLVHNN